MTDGLARLKTALSDRYTMERELGAGGMATVYLAQDLKHDRQVAIKVLKPELAAVLGAERFVVEIKTTAALQHPHILPLFDSGTADGFLYYVMPFIPGETLRTKLDRETQLGIDEAVRITTAVADALDYAHRQGVIHRDIKPENILLHEGRPMVADFGIALAVSAAAGGRMTETGLSLGTPHYMSPEQATAEKEISARSDVYSLASVLYEMLTGSPPHVGASAQQIIMKIVTEEAAPVTRLRKSVPPNVAAAVAKALERLPADRFGSAAEFAAALTNPAFALSAREHVVRRPASARVRALVPWVLLAAVGTLLAVDQFRPNPPPAAPVHRLTIVLPDDFAWVDQSGSAMALSPDGRMLVYYGRGPTGQRIYLRAMDHPDPIPIPESENGARPIFSPDGRWVGFIGNSGFEKVSVAGGVPEHVCRLGGYVWLTWLESDHVIFADGTGGLRQCSPAGEVTTLLASDSTETFNTPHGLPGDRGVLVTVRRDGVERLAVLDLESMTVKPLHIAGSSPRYVDTGHLVYVTSDGAVRATRFDLGSLTSSGEPVLLAQGVTNWARMAISRNGTIVIAEPSTGARSLELVDRSGRAEQLTREQREFSGPRFSPDGRHIAVSIGESSLWTLDRSQGTLTRLLTDGAALRPSWASDGRRIAYVRQVGSRVDLRIVSADGSTPPESLLALPTGLTPWHVLFAPDGRSLVVRTVGGPGVRDIWLKRPDSPALMPLLQGPANEVSPALSPDGRWLAYASNESGRTEVYVRSFPGMSGRHQVSLEGGEEPVWSQRGNELFYRSGAALIAAAFRGGDRFEVLHRTTLFSDNEYGDLDGTYQDYDVSRDAQHFVMVRRSVRMSQLQVILNAFHHLEVGGAGSAAEVR